MKYTVLGFQQSKLIENGLSIEDAFILRTIKDMYSTVSMEFKVIEGIKYMWINYTYFLHQIPILGSKRNLMRKIEFYGNECLLLRVLEFERSGVKGKFSYIAPTEKLDALQDYDLMTKSHNPYDKNDITLMTESHIKDTSIKDTSIKDNIIYSDIISYLNEKAGTSYRHTTNKNRTLIDARVAEGFLLEDFKTVIDKKVEDWLNTEYEQFLRPITLFGTKFESYLNQKDIPKNNTEKTSEWWKVDG